MNRRGFALSEWEETVLTLLEALDGRLGRIEGGLERRRLSQPEPGPPLYPPALLSTADAASYLGLKPQTLRMWRTRGGGPPYVRYGPKGRGTVVYKVADLEAWVNERRWIHTSAETVGYRPGQD
jgi:Helix-turn-helix domain